MSLTAEQQKLAEENMALVGQVIKERVDNPHKIGIFTYKDLFQIGCIGLCKAAETYDSTGNVEFSTYAYILIRNEIYKSLEYATVRRRREQILDPEDTVFAADDPFISAEYATELGSILDRLETETTGVLSKGIAALRLQAQGYSCKEIGRRFGGASDNNVSAWIAKARKYLKDDPVIASMAP